MRNKNSKNTVPKLEIRQLLKFFSEFFKADKLLLIVCLFISMISSVSIIMASIFTGFTLDEFISAFDADSPGGSTITTPEILNLLYAFLITITFYITYFISNHTLFMTTISLSYRAGSRIRRAVFEKLISVSINYIDKNKAGELISRTTTDVDQFISNTVQMFASMFVSPFIIFSAIIALLIYSPLLAVITFLMMIFFTMGTALIAKSAAPNYSKMQEKVGEIGSFSEEHIKNKVAIYLFSQQEKTIKEFDKINNKHAHEF
jgi:ABC-type multidrug transport system fused ATPase/permease subunit